MQQSRLVLRIEVRISSGQELTYLLCCIEMHHVFNSQTWKKLTFTVLHKVYIYLSLFLIVKNIFSRITGVKILIKFYVSLRMDNLVLQEIQIMQFLCFRILDWKSYMEMFSKTKNWNIMMLFVFKRSRVCHTCFFKCSSILEYFPNVEHCNGELKANFGRQNRQRIIML